MRKAFYLLIIISAFLIGCSENNDKSGGKSGSETTQFPNRPITIYVGFQAGGGTDMTARAVASLAQKYLGQPVNVINMPGASSTLAANKVATSKPDGYTLLIAGGSETVSVGNFKKLPYHPINDFTPIIRLTVEKAVLSINPDAPYKTLAEFVSEAKKHPGKYKYASSGQFGIFHSVGLAFSRAAGIDLQHVPYNGGAPSVAALMGNHVDLAITSPVSVATLYESGEVICVAQSSSGDRSTLLPNVSTMKELDYNITIENQKGLVAPANTPKERIKVLHDSFKKVLESQEFIDRAKKLQLEVAYLGPEDFQTSLQSTYAEIGNTLKRQN